VSALQGDDGLATQRYRGRRGQIRSTDFTVRSQWQLIAWYDDEKKRMAAMALNFPNESRSYDSRKQCVRFWAHDASFEVPFFVNADALCHIDPNATSDESGLLNVFDLNLECIRAAAGGA
jgi:hypothetical protein